MRGAYYNEFDPFAAEWLRLLIKEGHIAPGDVDERSIVDVRADDLKGYAQCHFFAGIGGWSLALRLAGVPYDRPVWTGSAPCQPFSTAGKRKAGADERHLWPVWLRLICECSPDLILGEQVEAAIGMGWIDRVFADLEEESYACGAAILGAHSVGAPHIRQRAWWIAYAERHQQSRMQPCRWPIGRVGRQQQSMAWDEGWQAALARFRVVDGGFPRCVAGTDAARNAIVPQVAAIFIQEALAAAAHA